MNERNGKDIDINSYRFSDKGITLNIEVQIREFMEIYKLGIIKDMVTITTTHLTNKVNQLIPETYL